MHVHTPALTTIYCIRRVMFRLIHTIDTTANGLNEERLYDVTQLCKAAIISYGISQTKFYDTQLKVRNHSQLYEAYLHVIPDSIYYLADIY